MRRTVSEGFSNGGGWELHGLFPALIRIVGHYFLSRGFHHDQSFDQSKLIVA
jgi:hypothetical protein